jgi:hypothetical protein
MAVPGDQLVIEDSQELELELLFDELCFLQAQKRSSVNIGR